MPGLKHFNKKGLALTMKMNKELLYQNKKIFYRNIGSGKPVLLIHGFGEDGEIWKNQIGFLKDNLPTGKAGFQLIVPDLPGSGKSEMIDDMSIEGMADVIKHILDTEAPPIPLRRDKLSPKGRLSNTKFIVDSIENEKSFLSESSEVLPLGEDLGGAVLIGHSMGGYITLAFIEKYPGYLSAFGLFHSSAYADSEEKKATRRKGIDFINQHGAFKFLKTSIPNLFSPRTKEENPGLIDEQLAHLRNFSPAALVSYYEAMIQRPDRTGLLQKATVPVLFIMGKYDNAILLEDGLKQSHLPEKSYIHILHQAGHMGMLEEAEKTNLILEKFLLEI